MFLEITRIWMNFAGGMQRRWNVSKTTAEVETPKAWAKARLTTHECRKARQSSAAS